MTHRFFQRVTIALGLCGVSGLIAAQPLHILAYQNPSTLSPVVEVFEQETGVAVEVTYQSAKQVLETLTSGKQPVDVVLSLEAKRLAALVKAGVLEPVTSGVLENAVPAHFRHPKNLWFGISKWSRSVFYAADRVDPNTIISLQSLTDERWRGRICVRTANKVYVQSLLASMIASKGESVTAAFAQALVKNFARQPVDLDMAQLSGVAQGVCDIAIANSYYYHRLMDLRYHPLSPEAGQLTRDLLETVKPLATGIDGQGVHMNISAVGMAKGAENAAQALQFMEYLVRPASQRLLVERGREFPIVDGARSSAAQSLFGDFAESRQPMSALADHYATAEALTRASGWLWD
ncbi:MAG: extracellular solute-binding protein [Lysobacterales bacterium]